MVVEMTVVVVKVEMGMVDIGDVNVIGRGCGDCVTPANASQRTLECIKINEIRTHLMDSKQSHSSLLLHSY